MDTASFDEIFTEGAAFLTKLDPGESVTITHEGHAVAVLFGIPSDGAVPRPLGCYSGQIKVRPDFNDPLPEWDEAMDSSLAP